MGLRRVNFSGAKGACLSGHPPAAERWPSSRRGERGTLQSSERGARIEEGAFRKDREAGWDSTCSETEGK